jgi:hypothetical protein
MWGDLDAGVLYFLARLKGIPAVCEQGGPGLVDQEHPCAAAESAEIVNIGKMGYETGMRTKARK